MRVSHRGREWARLVASAMLGALATMFVSSQREATCDHSVWSERAFTSSNSNAYLNTTNMMVSLSRRPPIVRTRYYKVPDAAHIGYGGATARQLFESRGWVVASAGRTGAQVSQRPHSQSSQFMSTQR